MFNYELPEYVVQNILTFLDRTKLEGAEAEALVEAKQYLRNPKQDEQQQ
ncbi:hypothetical protein [Paenibacillus sp. y28]